MDTLLPYKVHKLIPSPKEIARSRLVPIYNEE